MLPLESGVLARILLIQGALLALSLLVPLLLPLIFMLLPVALVLLPVVFALYARLLLRIGFFTVRLVVEEQRDNTLTLLRITPMSLRQILYSKAAAGVWRQVEDLGLVIMSASLLTLPVIGLLYAQYWAFEENTLVSRLTLMLGLLSSLLRLMLEPLMIAALALATGALVPVRIHANIALGGLVLLLLPAPQHAALAGAVAGPAHCARIHAAARPARTDRPRRAAAGAAPAHPGRGAMSANRPVVELRGLCRSFGEGERRRRVLNQVELQVTAGEFLVFLGKSGSGKSTLLNILSGIDRPDAGSVRVDGRELGAMSERELTRFRRDHIGIVFQFFNLIPILTVLENVILPAELAGESGPELRARGRELLARTGLEALADSLPGSAQRRRATARRHRARPHS